MWNYCETLDSDNEWNYFQREMTIEEIEFENYKANEEYNSNNK